ncbi:AAA family ATPase [Melittangium boletus]|uniref:ATPase AAA-type core domain-containing protein n=1 Tax=Melittangium boletus DSM 14713 TaxID=1294270 RepID=A0A250IE68_9BACT|nr:AAA family ATPase [Melittangium boletus]ATB29452.1 hypothetical protein MEBOL_002901 [Melittangium boletus DSM 14713]
MTASESSTRQAELAGFDRLLPALKEAYRRQRGKAWTSEELGAFAGLPAAEVARTLERFAAELGLAELLFGDDEGLVGAIQLSAAVEDTASFEAVHAGLAAQAPLRGPSHITELEVDGHRMLQRLVLRPGALTVLTGAPGSGKSSILDCLERLSLAMAGPVPSQGDSQVPERLHLSLRLESGAGQRVLYTVSLGGTRAVPRVTSERLEAGEGFAVLDFQNGQGVVRTATAEPPRPRVLATPRTVLAGELALRGALEAPVPGVVTSVRSLLEGWRFHRGFDVSAGAASRRPALSEPEPVLAADGANLSAVLFELWAAHPERWRELESHLRAALPSFEGLSVRPQGGLGTVMGVWREAGVREPLTLGELSDGTLLLLCLAVVCLSPRPAPLLVLDGLEVGLHPQVLPTLGALLQRAAMETQVLVATASSELIACLPTDARVLLTKASGRAVASRG